MSGEILRLIRICCNDLTIDEAAKRSGISDAYLCDIEKGKKRLTFKTLENLSKTYGIMPSSILIFNEMRKELKLDNQQLMIEILKYYVSKPNTTGADFSDNSSDKENSLKNEYSLGEVFRLIRICNNVMKITDAAKLSGISDSYLSTIETGKKNLSLEKIRVLSKVYNIPLSLVFYLEEIGNELNLNKQQLMIEILKYYLSKQNSIYIDLSSGEKKNVLGK